MSFVKGGKVQEVSSFGLDWSELFPLRIRKEPLGIAVSSTSLPGPQEALSPQ